jgi:RNA polymerase sigma-70 factor (ECF subfamily)
MNMQPHDDQLLISSLKQGDNGAYRQLVDRFGNQVFNVAISLLNNREDAEDVTQEVFTAIYHSIGRFRGDAALSTWIYRMTLSRTLEHIRTAQRKKRSGIMVRLFGGEKSVDMEAEHPFYHPGIQLENRERSAILFSAIKQLPENQKTAFILHKVEGLSQTEIAGIMEITVSAVESLMVRARQRLKVLLSDYYEKNER